MVSYVPMHEEPSSHSILMVTRPLADDPSCSNVVVKVEIAVHLSVFDAQFVS